MINRLLPAATFVALLLGWELLVRVAQIPHYTLPAFPLLALLLARQLVAIDFPARRPGRYE